jgi:GxxExxY protein
MPDVDLLYKEEAFAIVGAAIEVHRTLGPGFLEAVYQEAFQWELEERGIPFEPQRELRIWYKDRLLEKAYIVDVFCHSKIIVELKALDRLSGIEESQVLNYLKASRMRLGLLLNFGSTGKLEWKRLVL